MMMMASVIVLRSALIELIRKREPSGLTLNVLPLIPSWKAKRRCGGLVVRVGSVRTSIFTLGHYPSGKKSPCRCGSKPANSGSPRG